MAAAAPASGGAGSTWPAATSRFATACGALSQYVKAAEAERAQAQQARPTAVPARRPLPLMPGADVDATTASEDPAESGSAVPAPPLPAQMTIVYGERVLVLDGVPADRAAGLLRLAAAAAARGGAAAVMMEPRAGADLPVARKASLQRFMEKRKGRAAARAEPYSRRTTDGGDACPAAEDHLKLAL